MVSVCYLNAASNHPQHKNLLTLPTGTRQESKQSSILKGVDGALSNKHAAIAKALREYEMCQVIMEQQIEVVALKHQTPVDKEKQEI